MKKIILSLIAIICMASCTESIEDKAAREAEEYTQKVCPTPYVNDARPDTETLDKTSRTYTCL